MRPMFKEGWGLICEHMDNWWYWLTCQRVVHIEAIELDFVQHQTAVHKHPGMRIVIETINPTLLSVHHFVSIFVFSMMLQINVHIYKQILIERRYSPEVLLHNPHNHVRVSKCINIFFLNFCHADAIPPNKHACGYDGPYVSSCHINAVMTLTMPI